VNTSSGIIRFAVIVSFLFSVSANADETLNIGSGNPGLKVIAKQGNPNAVVIYHELPERLLGDLQAFS
jgi:hypothetical protein